MPAMNFYAPGQKQSGALNAGAIAPGAPPPAQPAQQSGVQYSDPLKGGGRNGFGYLDTDQIGTGQWGTGQSFQGAGRQAVVGALQGAMSDSNPLDTAGSDEARQYLRDQLAGLPGLSADKNSVMDTSMQRGLQNLLSQQRAGAAGTGTMGSRQYGGASGDITARAGSDYMNGLIQNRADAINQGLNISGGLQGIQSGDLNQRAFQLQEGQALAGGYENLMNMDAGRQQQLESERYGSEQQDKQMLNNDIMGIVQGGAMLAAGAPPMPKGGGGSNGAAAAGASGAFASTSPSGIPYGNPNYANDLYNGSYYGNPNSSGYGYGG